MTAMALKTVAVNPDKQALADLRAQIDRLDGALHDILLDRAELIDQVRRLKGKQHIYVRPGREAQMLRALVARPQGKLPEGLIVRVWRELISGFTLIEGALKAVQANKATVAVVPPPAANDKDAWWPLLASDKKNVLTVFACLPFETVKPGRSNARMTLPMGLIVGRLYPELTGDDRSFLAMQCVHVPEGEMRRLLGKAGYKVRQMLLQQIGRGGSAPMAFLIETEGYVGRNDTRLARLRAMLGSRLQYLAPLGGYAVPLKSGRR